MFNLLIALVFIVGMDMASFNSSPVEIFYEINSFLTPLEIFKFRLINRQFKQQAEDYADKMILMRRRERRFGLIREWQLLLLKTESHSLKEQLYKPILCKNHILLLKFIVNHREFLSLVSDLKRDVNGFLKPMLSYYKERIRDLDEFEELFECKHLMKREAVEGKCFREYDEFGYFLLLLSWLQHLQG